MKNSLFSKFVITALAISLVLPGCKKKDDEVLAPRKTYTLKAKSVGVSGTATFIKKSSTSVQIDISIAGAVAGLYPVNINTGSEIENGPVLYVLSPVDGTNKSSTVLTTVTYDELINMDGYLTVETSTGTVIAVADIGGNELTGPSRTWNINQEGASGVSGTAKVQKRKNGTSLMTISLNGTITGDSYPNHIHLGSVSTVGGGPVKVTLSHIDGLTGTTALSYTTIRTLDDGLTPITYDNILVYDGYIDVHTSDTDDTIICQGDIGSNVH